MKECGVGGGDWREEVGGYGLVGGDVCEWGRMEDAARGLEPSVAVMVSSALN